MRSWSAPAAAFLVALACGTARAGGGTTVEVEAPPGAPPYEELEPPDVDGLPYECQVGAWRVEGAGTEADAFQPIWQITLEQVAGCLAEPRLERACVAVRGQVTDAALPPEAVAAFGSREAARSVRAQGRAGLVAAKLDEIGVAPGRVVQLAPTGKASYDGVSLGLMLDGCGPPAPEVGPRPVPFLEAGGNGTLLLSSEIDSASPGFSLGAGLRLGRAFARTSVAYAAAGRREQRASADLAAAVGWKPAWWIEPALVGALRWGSTTPAQPWLERAWAVGLEATHCQAELWSFAELCARGAVLPLGRVWRRGAEDPTGLVRLPEEGFGSVRLDLGIVLRRGL